MMRWSTILLVVVLGCSDAGPTSTGPVPRTAGPTVLNRVGPGEFMVFPGSRLHEPLTVRATNAYGAVSNVNVQWEVVAGAGELLDYPALTPALPVSRTDVEGMARVFIRTLSRAPVLVYARVAGASDVVSFLVTPADFVEINFGAAFDCYALPDPRDPSLFEAPTSTIPAGVTVKWKYGAYMHPSCSARIVSTLIPPGGKPFDTGFISPGESASVVLNVAGDWGYEDVKNGGGGVIRVR